MSITRRTAVQTLAAAGATALLPKAVRAGSRKAPDPDAVAVLYDPTKCVGCRECILGCAEANGTDPELATSDRAELSPRALTVLHRYEPHGEPTFRKAQCMHCVDPACVSACMLGAMQKKRDGAVTWNGDLCVGCRYCQIACPFNIPRFEWDTPTPELTKCELCPERRSRGLEPACVEKCQRGALVYGTREEMLAEARRRIDEEPDAYNPKIYGEHDGGGTSVLYLARAGVSFAETGLPELGTESVPALPETIQHTLYKGFIAPLTLFGLFGALVHRNSKKIHEAENTAHTRHTSEPVGGKLLTWPFMTLLALFLVGLAAIFWRFSAGLGATTNLNDGYPMGLWIAFDVVTGTALACGGYAVALLVYLANRGKYHPLVRAALVTSALGYTLGGLSVLIDIGRAWNFYKIPLFFWEWNLNSILLEVALCIMLYTMVLWIEISPAFLEKWRKSRVEGVRKLALAASPRLERAMPYLIALGLLLPTMHQSSLGSLMLMAGAKLHPLWHTPLLPLLFLISCVAMGYAAVTIEAVLSARFFKRPQETPMLRALAVPIAGVLLAYVATRLVEVAANGELGLVTALDGYSLLFLGEMALFTLPALGLVLMRKRAGPRFLMSVGLTVILAGALYRFSTYLFAFNPGPGWTYFPAVPEFAVTVGLVAAELMGYLILVKRFPILRGVTREKGTPARTDVARKSGRFSGMRPSVPTGAAGLLLLLGFLLGPAGLGAQQRPVGNLKCLTADPATCLDEPVSSDEPHDAVCATCHNLWDQKALSEAARTCASARCHDRPQELSDFHRGLHDAVMEDCTGCHDPHDARIPGGDENCAYCHEEGGEWARARPPGERVVREGRVVTPVSFRHTTHGEIECVACHAAGEQHQAFKVDQLADCRSCHHRPPVSRNCMACHSGDDARRIVDHVTRTLAMEVGSLDHPRRTLPFDHERHREVECRTCHTEGLALSAAGSDCSRCHEQHHRETASCITCHARPAPEAHDVRAHLGCGGTGCHQRVPSSVMTPSRTRELCLACHQELVYHRPEEECTYCHVLPPPREGGY